MARLNWLFPKKRGVRRTGSRLLGRVGEASFYLALFLIGFAGLAFVIWSLIARRGPLESTFASVYCQQGVGVVEAMRVHPRPTDAGEQLYAPQLRIRYNDGARQRSVWTDLSKGLADEAAARAALEGYDEDQQVDCWFDPAGTDVVHLQQPPTWGLWLTIVILLAVAGAGGYGVIATGLAVATSTERRAALERAAQTPLDFTEFDLPAEEEFPTVPCDPNLINSPGLKLGYRLPPMQQPAWQLFTSSILALACGALAVALAVVAIEQHMAGHARWILTCFAVVMLLLGGGAIYYFMRELIQAGWIGPVVVEISHMPLWPGSECEAHITQTGTMTVQRLCLLLVCEEETVFLQGTDIRHEQQRVFQAELFSRQGFEIDVHTPLEAYFSLSVPPEAMHSYKSRHNAVQWKLVVELDAADAPPTRRVFPLVVYPEPLTARRDDGPTDRHHA